MQGRGSKTCLPFSRGLSCIPLLDPKLGRPLKDYSIYIWVPYGLCMDTHPMNPKPVIQSWVPPAISSPLRCRVQTLQYDLPPGSLKVGMGNPTNEQVRVFRSLHRV